MVGYNIYMDDTHHKIVMLSTWISFFYGIKISTSLIKEFLRAGMSVRTLVKAVEIQSNELYR